MRDVAHQADNSEAAMKFLKAVIAWFPEADPPEEWTKQNVAMCRRYSDETLRIAFLRLRERGLKRLPTVSQIDFDIREAAKEAMSRAEARKHEARKSPAELRVQAFDHLCRNIRAYQAELRAIAQAGWGALALTKLTSDAWAQAQGQPFRWDFEWAEKLTQRPGPGVPPYIIAFGNFLPKDCIDTLSK